MTFAIRSAMTQPVAHSHDEVAVQWGVPLEIEYSYQTAQ